MMYTEEQVKKAIWEKRIHDFKKQVAFDNHKRAIDWIDMYNLPYRVSLEYQNRTHENEVHINPFYPFQEVPNEGKWHYEKDGGYSFDEWARICTRPKETQLEDGYTYIEWYTPDWIQELIDEKAKPFKQWDLETKTGLEKWLYYFMVFIMPYEEQIPTWKSFDMFGDNKHSESELAERKQYYMELIAKCKANPNIYKHDIEILETKTMEVVEFD